MTESLVGLRKTEALKIWEETVFQVAFRWEEAAMVSRARGEEPHWLEEALDDGLQEAVGAAIRASDLEATRHAAAAWREAWARLLKEPPPNLSVGGEPAAGKEIRHSNPSGLHLEGAEAETALNQSGTHLKESQMKLGKYFQSKYLRAVDLRNPVKVTIAGVREELVGLGEDAAEKPVLYFKGAKQGLVLNRTNFDALVAIFGTEDSDGWIGKVVEIYNDPSVNFGGVRGGVRIREIPGFRSGRKGPSASKPQGPILSEEEAGSFPEPQGFEPEEAEGEPAPF